MSAMEVDPQEEEIEVPSSSTSKQDKKRFEVKKVRLLMRTEVFLLQEQPPDYNITSVYGSESLYHYNVFLFFIGIFICDVCVYLKYKHSLFSVYSCEAVRGHSYSN